MQFVTVKCQSQIAANLAEWLRVELKAIMMIMTAPLRFYGFAHRATGNGTKKTEKAQTLSESASPNTGSALGHCRLLNPTGAATVRHTPTHIHPRLRSAGRAYQGG